MEKTESTSRNSALSPPTKVDMSPEAIERRLILLGAVSELGIHLRDGVRVIPPEEVEARLARDKAGK